MADADTVYLAELSMMRRVGARDIEFTFTSVVQLAGDEVPPGALTMRPHEAPICLTGERVGDELIVYARKSPEGFAIVGLVAQSNIIDAGWRRTIRAVARGQLPSPIYPD